ncbi:MAG: SPOR domain-containing protein [Corynebacterium sp.]|nr:SPOR domain-containing protein [Corynebacterium sp.]
MADSDMKWFYDLSTGEVSQGKTTGFETRMGPYDTEAAARHALEIVKARNDIADDWDDEPEED